MTDLEHLQKLEKGYECFAKGLELALPMLKEIVRQEAELFYSAETIQENK